jgi:hypothetical protein
VRILDRGGGDLVLMLEGAGEKQTVGPEICLSTNNLLWAKKNNRKCPLIIQSRTLRVLCPASRQLVTEIYQTFTVPSRAFILL